MCLLVSSVFSNSRLIGSRSGDYDFPPCMQRTWKNLKKTNENTERERERERERVREREREEKLWYWPYHVVTHLLWKHNENLHTKLFTQYSQKRNLAPQIKMT